MVDKWLDCHKDLSHAPLIVLGQGGGLDNGRGGVELVASVKN